MEKIMEATRTELMHALKLWCEYAGDSIDEAEAYADADYLISLIQEIQSGD